MSRHDMDTNQSSAPTPEGADPELTARMRQAENLAAQRTVETVLVGAAALWGIGRGLGSVVEDHVLVPLRRAVVETVEEVRTGLRETGRTLHDLVNDDFGHPAPGTPLGTHKEAPAAHASPDMACGADQADHETVDEDEQAAYHALMQARLEAEDVVARAVEQAEEAVEQAQKMARAAYRDAERMADGAGRDMGRIMGQVRSEFSRMFSDSGLPKAGNTAMPKASAPRPATSSPDLPEGSLSRVISALIFGVLDPDQACRNAADKPSSPATQTAQVQPSDSTSDIHPEGSDDIALRQDTPYSHEKLNHYVEIERARLRAIRAAGGLGHGTTAGAASSTPATPSTNHVDTQDTH